MAKKAGNTKSAPAPVPAPAIFERGDILVVGTKMKDVVKNAGCMSSAELIEAVSAKVHDMLISAAERAKQNGRTTVRPYDL